MARRGEPGGLPDVGAGGVRAEVRVAAEVRRGGAGRRRGAVEPAAPVRRGAGAVGHADAGAAGRGGPAVAAVLLPALVRGAAAGQGSGGVRLPGRALPAVGGRHGAPLVEEGALRELLREAPPGRHDDVLPHDAGGGAGASGGAGGVPAGAGADREVGRVEEERLRAQRGEAAARGRSAGASAPEAGGGGGRAGVERAAHRTAQEAGHAFRPGREAGRPRTGGSSVPVRVGGQHARHAHGGVRRGGRRAAPVPLAERGAAERRELRPGGELPGIPGDHPGGQGPALLVGDGPAGRRGQPDGADARRAGAVAACR